MKNKSLIFSFILICFSFSFSALAYDFGNVTLKNGSQGEAVMELQRFLNANLNLGLIVDGKLGSKTITVIRKWQKNNGLKDDGLIGEKTKIKMNSTVDIAENGYVNDRDQREQQARKTPDATCKSSINKQLAMNPSFETDPNFNLGCEKFLELWYGYHSDRLGISKNDVDKMTALESFSVNSKENQKLNEGITMYRVDYFVNYGGDISILTHDSFPISIPQTVKLFPSVNISRDNSPLTLKDIKNIGTAFDSNLTSFPLGPLAYETKSSIKKDIENIYLHAKVDRGSIDNIDFILDFNRSSVPIASLSGSDSNRQNCYGGEHNLLTKKGTIHWGGPCAVN